jgi:hypothetical protein
MFLPMDLCNAIQEVIQDVADAVLAYSHGGKTLIRYLPGHLHDSTIPPWR